ncbi:MAG: hypothetical protein HYS05_16190 [Acidobacteria bacterium]|nr:hypothetical protein [Acidobacteriota bacterium]
MKHDTAGDPITGVKWSRRTTRKIAEQLATLGIGVSKNTVGRLLKQLQYRLRVNRKQIAASKSPDRNSQFVYIGEQRERFADQGLPVISVDSNYDPSGIMDIARGPIRVHAVVIERQPHALIPSVYT